MADYKEFMSYPEPYEWEKRYQKRSNYNEAICYRCGSIVQISWGIEKHDSFHANIEAGI